MWKINTRVILSWCFGRFLKRFLLSIKFTFCIFGRMISDFCLLSVNHDSKPNNYKLTPLEQIRFIWKAGSYGIDFLLTGLWHDVACKYWCVSVDFVNKLVIKLHSKSPKIWSNSDQLTSEILFKLWKIINLKTLLKNKEELKIVEATSITDQAGNIVGAGRRGIRIFARQNFSQAEQVILRVEIWEGVVSFLMRSRGMKFLEDLEINVS